MTTILKGYYHLVTGYKVTVSLIDDYKDFPEKRYKIKVSGMTRVCHEDLATAIKHHDLIIKYKNDSSLVIKNL